MPLYTLKCTKCNHEVDRLMKLSDAVEDEECPLCETRSLQKKTTSFANYAINGNNSASVRPRNASKIGGGK
jgi:putative FmdB family regulatory protein